jgi:meso-butanediol dehydrogenase / (S,S)-butanediol dehydrogenase / diacetyl reductase
VSRLTGKVALVTGGGTGIGRGIVEELVRQDARVVALGRRREPLEELAKQLGDRVAVLSADVTRDSRRAVEFALERFSQLDVVVNNAGAFLKAPLAKTSDAQIAEMLTVNVQAPLSLAREAIPALAKTRGSIIHISSAAGSYVRADLSAYGAAKAAIHHVTKILAVELGPLGIRCNSVAPGFTRSDMTEPITGSPNAMKFFLEHTALGRMGEPIDIARVVAFLASDDAGWVTGQTIAASGGLLL